MSFDFLPKRIFDALTLCDVDKLCEIRIRTNFPILLVFDNMKAYLSDEGCSVLKTAAIVATKDDILKTIRNVTEFSIYAFNQNIKQGYLTTKEGIRIGLAGDCVFDNDDIITIKNFTSLNIRIPHEVNCCSNYLLSKIIKKDTLFNTLIISPPFYGKTTMLKDLARNINRLEIGSILLVDERGEFNKITGENIDKMAYCNKAYAFQYGIRSLAPKIIITDELGDKKDWNCVNNAVFCGVKVIASCHGCSIEDVVNKEYFYKNIFERYVILNEKKVVESVYDKDFVLI